MNKKTIYRLLAIVIALIVSAGFMLCDLDLTPLTKVFVIFFSGIVGLKCIPATFLFTGMVKGIFFNTEATLNQSGSLTRSGVKL